MSKNKLPPPGFENHKINNEFTFRSNSESYIPEKIIKKKLPPPGFENHKITSSFSFMTNLKSYIPEKQVISIPEKQVISIPEKQINLSLFFTNKILF